ncbi:MAG TPA: hypothetical protein VIK14_04185 [Ignavibacteria bacterium]
MYSPKIDDSLIPIIYTKTKQSKKPITKLVNDLSKEKLTGKGEDEPVTTESTEQKLNQSHYE